MRKVLFYERQNFNAIGFASAVIVGIIGLLLILPAPDSEQPVDIAQGLVGVFMLVVAVIVLNLLTMTTWVYEDEIRVQFGRLVPYYNKRIARGDLTEFRVVEYKPIRNAGGWGIRIGVFEGKKTRYLNARGSTGILLETPETRYIIGTQFPDAFLDALNSEAK